MTSSHTHADGDGKAIASGGVLVRKEHSYAEFKEVQWSVNQVSGFPFNNTSRLLKFELRRPPKNEKIEDIVIKWTELNPSGVDVNKLPTFFNCVDSVRVMINNKEVVDLKSVQGIRTEWRDRLYTRYNSKAERDYAWNWRTGNTSLETGSGLISEITLLAGGQRQLYASMSDLLGGVFDGLCWSRINLVEIEMTLTYEQKLIGDVPECLQVLHNNIQVYSRHKVHTLVPPRMFSNWTLFHNEHEVIKITSPSPLHFGGNGELTVDLHQFIPKRSNIKRIHIYEQKGVSDPSAYRRMGTLFIDKLRLERNGDPFLATEWFYGDRRQVAHQGQKYFHRHHGGVATAIADNLDPNFGSNMSEMFVDTTAVTKSINFTPSQETKVVASEGIDNQDNLNLIINSYGAIRLDADSECVIVVEWGRYDRINPSGNVIRIITP
jgi:hypothetical protein